MSRILIIGDTCEDRWVYGKCDRLSPDGPVPVLVPTDDKKNKGMAGNVYENVISLIKKLNLSIDVDFITNEDIVTKTRYVDGKSNQLIVRVDTGDDHVKRFTGWDELYNKKDFDAVIVSDYDKGFLHCNDIEFICESYDNVFVDTKKKLGDWIKSASYIKINEKEYNNSEGLFNENSFMDKLIVTLGENGCRYNGNIYPVETVEVKDMVGAGDTFIAALVIKFLTDDNIDEAISFANECATEVVQRVGVNTIE